MAKKQIATFLAPNKGLSVVGTHCYAYNNAAVGTAETTILEFTTGKFYIVGQIHYSKNTFDGDDMQYQLYFNGSLVLGFTDQYSANDFAYQAYPIVIPPLTLVKATSTDDTGDNARPVFCSITGRIYNA
mgnify:CR=1 FL=1